MNEDFENLFNEHVAGDKKVAGIFNRLPQGSSIEDVISGQIKYWDCHGSERYVSAKPLFDRIAELERQLDCAKSVINEFITEHCDRDDAEDMPKIPADQSCDIVRKAMTFIGGGDPW